MSLKHTTLTHIFGILLLTPSFAEKMLNQLADGTLAPLSIEESLKHIEVPNGFKLELVASEPMVQEPVCFTFDSDGALFVCEWNSYMQDQYGTDQDKPVSRIVKLTDTNGDGKMDKRTVFAKDLMLPRSILTLHDRVLVRFTHNSTIWSYFDDNGDGISDRKEIALQGSSVGGNIEHQDNSLIWNSDNKIYATGQIYQFRDGKLTQQRSHGRYGQWGLTRDDVGRIYGSHNSAPLKNWFNLGGYPMGNPSLAKETFKANFTCEVDDATDSGRNVTATGGQTILRSEQFGELKGALVIPDSVRRIVKLVTLDQNDGQITPATHDDYKNTEFIRSADTYFRPVWTGMGPDGGLYIADMSRGIVQESQWFPTERTKNPNKDWLERYYRTKAWGMLKVNSRGRIYRLIPEDSANLESPIQLSTVSSADLANYLEHKNGWWRDTAHKLIVCRNDKSAIPNVRKLLNSNNPFTRLSALQILDFYSSLEKKELKSALKDMNENVRVHAISLSEKRFTSDPDFFTLVSNLATDPSPFVVAQLYLSTEKLNTTDSINLRKQIVSSHPNNIAVASLDRKKNKLRGSLKKYIPGHKIYQSLCIDCHGQGNQGIESMGKLFAPKFTRNSRMADKVYLTKVLLHGITGPLGENEETYSAGIMPPMGATYTDQELADVLNYIGRRWGKWKKDISADEIKVIRAATSERKLPWTYSEAKSKKS
ncbi:MAG: c-type cytochrome [Rubritalea sp.]|uniref:DUF7133 domain-containing protein n=1 Tax=Rubritalea sp. TaxID=2109375 RepID=UPI0032422F50